jgi:diacylglycerol kinase family enzyme/molybdopterin converting factor small subunit
VAHVRVRLFAALRDLAGAGAVDADGETAGDVLDELCVRFGERFEAIARSGSLVVDGERATAGRALGEGDEVAVLPPVSGGSRGFVAWRLGYSAVVAGRFHRVLLVVNPVARTVSRPTLAVIEKALSADFDLEVLETVERGHATKIAADAAADGIDVVVVFSGDGTINEALNGLIGTDTALGVIPGGATNILVRALAMPLDPVEATGVLIANALDGRMRTMHLGLADDRYFAVNCGAGIDAAAMKRLDARFPKSKARFERAAFRSVAWELIASYAGKASDLAVRVDGDAPAPSLSVMIGRTDPYTYYKDRGVRVTPDASFETGLDVLSARHLPRRSVARIAWQVFGSARHVRGRDIDYWHNASEVRVTSVSPFPVQVDGDVMEDRTSLTVELARDALRVVA